MKVFHCSWCDYKYSGLTQEEGLVIFYSFFWSGIPLYSSFAFLAVLLVSFLFFLVDSKVSYLIPEESSYFILIFLFSCSDCITTLSKCVTLWSPRASNEAPKMHFKFLTTEFLLCLLKDLYCMMTSCWDPIPHPMNTCSPYFYGMGTVGVGKRSPSP